MAQRVTINLVDDLDGESTADTTVTFAYEGVTYEIDLTTRNANKLGDALRPFVAKARRVGGRKVTTGKAKASTGKASASGVDNSAVREWARANGKDVNDRGRVPAELVEAYKAANAA